MSDTLNSSELSNLAIKTIIKWIIGTDDGIETDLVRANVNLHEESICKNSNCYYVGNPPRHGRHKQCPFCLSDLIKISDLGTPIYEKIKDYFKCDSNFRVIEDNIVWNIPDKYYCFHCHDSPLFVNIDINNKNERRWICKSCKDCTICNSGRLMNCQNIPSKFSLKDGSKWEKKWGEFWICTLEEYKECEMLSSNERT